MPRAVLCLVITAVAVTVALAVRSTRDTPPAPVAKAVAATEPADAPASIDDSLWQVTRSRTTASRANPPRGIRPAGGAIRTGKADGARDAEDLPRTHARAPKPGPAPRANGTPDEFLSDALFRRLDEDGDGALRGNEIPTALRADDGSRAALTPERFTALFVEAVEARRASDLAAPAWFTELDPECSGRVSRQHWRDSGRADDEFQRIDTDGDGFVSRHEAAAVATKSAASLGAIVPARAAPSAPATSGVTGASAEAVAGEETPKSKADALFEHYTATAAAHPTRPRRSAVTAVAPPKKPAATPAPTPPPAAPLPPAKPPKPPAGPQATLPEPIVGNAYWVQRNDENGAALTAGVRPDVLFLGDSITDFLAHGPGKPLWDEVYAPLAGLNFGVGGITTSHVLWQVETGQVALANPKAVVLLIGSNNLGAGQRPNDVAAGVEKIVDTIGAQLPDTKVMVVGILPRGRAATDPFRDTIPETNRLIADAVGDRAAYTDVGAVFLSPDNSIPPNLMPDGCHPSLYGYGLYTTAIWPTLTGVAPKR